MKQPIEAALDALEWKPIADENIHEDGTYPYATHEGVLEIGTMKLKVYQLSDGKRVIAHDDFLAFFGGGFDWPVEMFRDGE
jgi:hypothetical protein